MREGRKSVSIRKKREKSACGREEAGNELFFRKGKRGAKKHDVLEKVVQKKRRTHRRRPQSRPPWDKSPFPSTQREPGGEGGKVYQAVVEKKRGAIGAK